MTQAAYFIAAAVIAALFALYLSYSQPRPLEAPRQHGKVAYVIDGDTIHLGGERFRLVGLDTPETYDPQCAYEKALGDEATRRLRELIGSGELVELIVLPGRDRYDRGLARLYIGRADVAGILIGEGLAREYNGGRRQGWC